MNDYRPVKTVSIMELGVPTPYNELFYHAIKVLEQKNEGLF